MSPGRRDEKSTRRPAKTKSPLEPQVSQPDKSAADGPYVVGVGGSAGGLEAFERLFAGMPVDTGIAFVVIQHLDPTHKALMPELLQRATALKVVEITDGVEVEANCILVLPPGHYVAIKGGQLWLSPPSGPRAAIRTPVDFFFSSLAADRKEKSIGIIVSGMGMDGTVGIRAIKEQLGAVLVQEPISAKYDGMPTSAVATGLADYVVPVEDMPAILVSYVQHASRTSLRPPAKSAKAQSSLQRILGLLRSITGHDFSLYKKGTLYRRIERRVSIHHLDGIASYAKYLEDNPNEANILFKDLFIGVTSFFRDREAYDALREKAIPALIAGKSQDDAIRIWVAGCATGEEAYSIIILLQETLDRLAPGLNIKIQVFATDIDAAAIDTARRGIYPASSVDGVSPERLERFFVRTDDSYQVKKSIRDAVVFAPHNIISDPPFTKLDMISCRNLLIYFSADLQKMLVPIFHYALNPGGILFLGSSETISGFSNLFSTTDSKWKLFKRKDYPAVWTGMVDLRTLPIALRHPEPIAAVKEKPGNVAEMAQRVLLSDFAPAAVVIDAEGDILYVSGRTGKYLELPEGRANWNLCSMAREGLRYDLSASLRKATKEKTEVSLKGVSVKTDAGDQLVDLTVRPFSPPEGMDGLLLVIFQEAASPTKIAPYDTTDGEGGMICPRCPELEQELKRTKEYLQTTIEEMQSAQEEMLSANEEFQSTNEELQSTNEELMTSKEELQSLNEELTTVNTELQMKNDELARTNNDMVNLLNSTEIATIFLDTHLNVRRFTPSVQGILSLRQSDIGRPVGDIAPNLTYDALVSDARQVLDTLAIKQVQVTTKEGLWYAMRLMPYRTLDNVIDGVVVTFSDISAPKAAEELLRKYQLLSGNTRDIVFFIRQDGRIIEANEAAVLAYGYTHEEFLDLTVFDLRTPASLPDAAAQLSAADETGILFEAEHRRKDGTAFDAEVSSRATDMGGERIVLSVVRDITERKRALDALRESERRVAGIIESITDCYYAVDTDWRITGVNSQALAYFGMTREELVGRTVWDAFPYVGGTVLEEQFRKASEEKQPVHFEFASPEQNRWADVHAYPSRSGLEVYFRNITERKRAEQLSEALNDVNAAMRTTLDFDAMMAMVVTESVAAMGLESGCVLMREDDQWVVTHEHAFDRLAVGTRFSNEDIPKSALAVRERRPIAVNDTSNAGDDNYSTMEKLGIRAFLAIPLVVGDGTAGILWLNNHSGPFTFGDAEIDFATRLAASVSMAFENVQLYTRERDARGREEMLRTKLQAQHSEMQQALLPGETPAIDGCEIATRFVPGTTGEQLGGDFYDIFQTEDGRVAIMIGDVSGKGIEAGALAAVTRSTVRAFAYELPSPGTTLSHANSLICRQDIQSDRFATVFLAVLDPKSGRLSYSSAGHPPAMIVRASGGVERHSTTNLPMRVKGDVDYASFDTDLRPGDKLVLYTDGISEAHSNTGMYDIEGIERTLGYQPDGSPAETLDTLFRTASDFSAGKLADDAAVIVVGLVSH